MSTLKVTHLQNENGTGPAMSLAVGGGVTFAGITTFHSNVDLGSNSLSGDLTGNVTGNVTGNLTGDVTVATGATVSGSTNTITASTNGEERLRVNSSGRVGIGTDTSGFATRLVVGTGDGETGNMTLFSGPSSSAYIHFADGTSGADRYRGYVTYSHSDNSLQFGTNDTEAARFNSSGNLAFPNGQGIDFSASAGSGIITNGGILDDYEEGTWTPEFADASSGGNTGTYLTNRSWYRKIGNTVYAFMIIYDVDTTGMTGSNTLWVRGLPFATASGDFELFTGFGTCAPLANQTDFGIPFLNTNGGLNTQFRISYNSSTSGSKSALVSDITSGTTDIFMCIPYYI